MEKLPIKQTAPWLGMGEIDHEFCADAHKKLEALMIFVDFPNKKAVNAEAPYNSIDYYKSILADDGMRVLGEISYNSLKLNITCAGKWHTMPKNDDEYGMDRVISYEVHAAYISDACDACSADYDLDKYDILYIVPVYGSAVPYSPTLVSRTHPVCGTRSANKTGLCVTFGADMHSRRGLLLAHETGHILGLPDYYLYQCEPHMDFSYCGGWSLMGLIEGFAPDWFKYDKWRLGFIDDASVRIVTESCEIPVSSDGVNLVIVPNRGEDPENAGTKAVAIEYREAGGLDSALAKYGERGIVMYELDGETSGGMGCLRVIPKSGDEAYDRKLEVRNCHEFVVDGESVAACGVEAFYSDGKLKLLIK